VPAAARRNHPFNDPAYGSQPAAYYLGQPQGNFFHGAAGRRCLPSVPRDGWGAWQGRLKY